MTDDALNEQFAQFARRQVAVAAIEAAVDWTMRQVHTREEAPRSWDAGFPGMKALALLCLVPRFDAGQWLAAHDAALAAAVRERCCSAMCRWCAKGSPAELDNLRRWIHWVESPQGTQVCVFCEADGIRALPLLEADRRDEQTALFAGGRDAKAEQEQRDERIRLEARLAQLKLEELK